jgi:F-type H+-transporting ATPase subunit epsilon
VQPPTLMNLKVLLPFRIFAEKTGVTRIVAETQEGSFGLLPHRLDCVAALVPGILIYENEAEGEVYVAVDEGGADQDRLGRARLRAARHSRNGAPPTA